MSSAPSKSAHPTSLREQKKQRTRDTLIDAALRLFQEQGFAETTLDEVCASAEVSKRTFFRYFAGKEDVVLAPSHELWLVFLHEVQAADPEGAPVFKTLQQALLAALDQIATPQWAERINAARLLAQASPSITAQNLKFCDGISGETARALRCGLDPAGPEDLRPRLAQDLLVAAFHSAMEQWTRHSGPKTCADLRLRVQEAFVAAAQATTYSA
ncbi:TetR family transcriptional regulator [Streptomyces olivaceus]|uniref:TetR family transcriptional regulator n=1 Tax=Streptomyces olivaceus TaxID=47716 RepID=UPI0036C02F73